MSSHKLLDSFNAAAAAGIEKPRLRFLDFTVSLAPRSGKNPGYLYVKSTRDRTYLGKISPSGSVHLLYDAVRHNPSIATDIENLIADPYSATKVYGLQTGSCSCCGRKLTNTLSVRLGIGPVCREKFGWADLDPAEEEQEQEQEQEPEQLLLSL